jgi:TolA-binding protein
MGRWLVGMSGDKDAMIAHLEKCEKRMLEQFALIRKLASEIDDIGLRSHRIEATASIIELCDVYLDKRSDKQKMQDQIDELQDKLEKMEGVSECECC